jgi:putative transposase
MHVIQAGNNRQICFGADEDCHFYRDWLMEYSEKFGCQIHAQVLMTNHVHLLITLARNESIGQLMKQLGQRYEKYFTRPICAEALYWKGGFGRA